MILITILSIGACTTGTSVDPNRVEWSSGISDDPAYVADQTIACGQAVAHPCPWLTFMGRMDLVGDQVTWSEPSRSFTEPLPIVETVVVNDDGSITFPERSDESGERLPSTVQPDGGDFVWRLYNVAGETSFHFERTPGPPPAVPCPVLPCDPEVSACYYCPAS
jgi:hypothetical protein